jgi:hypothetical protein
MRGSAPGTAILKAVQVAGAPRETLHRRRVAVQYNATINRTVMEPSRGYGLVSPGDFSDLDKIVGTCQKLFEEKRAAYEAHMAAAASTAERRQSQMGQKRQFLRNLLSNEDLHQHTELVDFALSDATLGVATKYLGSIPHLNRVDLLYSVPREGDDRISSQLFHVDPEGLSQVKFFINVYPTGDADGPFTFIPADDTARILKDIRRLRRQQGKPHIGRYTDEEVAAVGGAGTVVTVKGPAASGVAVDTSRCLHLGSRVQPGSFRLCLYVQYCTSREHGNVFDVARFRNDPVRYLAVSHSTASTGLDVEAPHQMGS